MFLCITYFLKQRIGQLFTGFIVLCKIVDCFFVLTPIFHDLRWQLDRIPFDPTYASRVAERDFCQHMLQTVTKLVKQRAKIIESH